jgi:hypothetical protein
MSPCIAAVVSAGRSVGRCAAGCAAASLFGALAFSGCSDRDYPEAPAAPATAAPRGPALSGGVGSPASGGADGSYAASAASAAEPASEEVTEADADEAVRRATTAAIVEELKLPPPPPTVVIGGEEPYKQHAQHPKFEEFRRKAGRYIQLKRQLLPLGRKLAEGTATAEERARHNRIEEAMAEEFRPLNAYLWDDRWTEEDRAAMGWILFVPPE